MAKKCLINQEIIGTFLRNTTHPEVYDLQTISGDKMPFSYFRIAQPRERYLIGQGAVKVVESHKNGVKVLHTGLRRTSDDMIFAGNLYNPVNGKLSFLLFKSDPITHTITVYLFPDRKPKNINQYVEEVRR